MLFLDFSSVFNTFISRHLISKLAPLASAPIKYKQQMHISFCGWAKVSPVSSLQVPVHLRAVSCTLLLTMMTHDCCAKSTTNYIVKVADDTTVVDLIQDDSDLGYREKVKQLVYWLKANNLVLIVQMTK